jgi:hypothetical protein
MPTLKVETCILGRHKVGKATFIRSARQAFLAAPDFIVSGSAGAAEFTFSSINTDRNYGDVVMGRPQLFILIADVSALECHKLQEDLTRIREHKYGDSTGALIAVFMNKCDLSLNSEVLDTLMIIAHNNNVFYFEGSAKYAFGPTKLFSSITTYFIFQEKLFQAIDLIKKNSSPELEKSAQKLYEKLDEFYREQERVVKGLKKQFSEIKEKTNFLEAKCSSYKLSNISPNFYSINDEIGRGVSGNVSSGVMLRNKMPIAIKEGMVNDYCSVESMKNRFERESAVLEKLNHPNIIPILAISIVENTFRIIMPLMKRGTLLDVLRNNTDYSDLSWNRRYHMSSNVADALYYLHEIMKLLHHDVKAQNILVDGDFNTILGDFGESKQIDDPTESSVKDKIRSCGSIPWMAPEVLNYQPYTSQSEVYSFGLVLWAIAARKEPWRTTTIKELISRVREGALEEIPSNTPTAYSDLIKCCLFKIPSERCEIEKARETLASLSQAATKDSTLSHGHLPSQQLA